MENEEIDISAVVADIGNDLFPSTSEASASESGATEAAQEVAPEAAPTLPSGKPLPKSWKKDMEAHWGKMDPAVHDYVHEREANILRGLGQYAEGHKRWNSLLQPFQEVLQQHPDVEPVALMQGLMNTHLQLLQGDAGTKRQFAQQLLQHYGIDLSGNSPEPNSELLELRREVQELKSGFTASQKAVFDATFKEKLQIVEQFSADPVNKYYPEVAEDIKRFLQSGVTRDLKEAYDLACYANPVVRQKLLADQRVPAPGQPAKTKFPNLNANGTMTPSRGKPGSIDDTINSIVSKHYSSH